LLEVLGLTDLEERVYVYLLDAPDRSLHAVAGALDLAAPKVVRVVDGLVAHGLATTTEGEPREVVPHPPDIALEALIRRREEDLKRVRLRAQAFARRR
jgi:sugar-specific transcriptional regulator TrmB